MRTKIVVMYDRLETHAAVSAAPKKDDPEFPAVCSARPIKTRITKS
jgi:hypothetical protein